MLPRFRRGVTLTNTLLRGFDEFACWRFGASACIAAGPNRSASFRTPVSFRPIINGSSHTYSPRPKWGNCSVRLRSLKRNPASPLRPELTRLAIVLLFTTGMRRGELLKLTLGDYDRQEATLHIRETKFYKSRLLPINGEIADEIERYLRVRARRRLPVSADTPLMWNATRGGRAYTGTGLRHCCAAPPRTLRHHHNHREVAENPGSSAQLRCQCPAALVPSRRRCRG